MSRIREKIRSTWDGLSSKEKKRAIIALVVCGLFFMMIVSYRMGGKRSVPLPLPPKAETADPLERNLLEKSLYHEKEKELRQRDEEYKSLKAEIEEMKKEKEREKEKATRQYPPVPLPQVSPDGAMHEGTAASPYPPVPAPPGQQAGQRAEPELSGKIEVFSNPLARKAKAEPAAEKKKDHVQNILLPPSFVPAVVLTGIRAKTGGEGKGEPQPMLLMATDLAVLPNRVKKNLKGCFFVANGMGDLSQERVDVRLVSLHCLARDGRVVVNQKVKGTVMDADGVINLDGKVVARWGSSLAASMYAGFFGGIGDGLKGASTQTLTTASGTLQTIKPGDMLLGAAGSGFSGAFHKIADFMLEVARQAAPVVEAGNLKPVDVFITEAVELEVRTDCNGLLELGGAECKENI